MDLSDLADLVGAERFERACAMAWASAEDTGTRGGMSWPDDLGNVPHELSDAVEGDLELAFALYRAMPCYANMMYVGHWGIGPRFWAQLRTLLDHADPRLANPVLYWLWCGPFEAAGAETETAWHEMTTEADGLRLRRLFGASGPVPWRLKAPLLETLATNPEWHRTVRKAIEAAATDVFGSIDMPAARRLLGHMGHSDNEIRNLLN
jgi:hypothetical protein